MQDWCMQPLPHNATLVEGVFGLPGAQRAVLFGTLRVSRGHLPRLRLLGAEEAFNRIGVTPPQGPIPAPMPAAVTTLHGTVAERARAPLATVFGAHLEGITWHGGIVTADFVCDAALLGAHVGSRHEHQFVSSSHTLPSLTQWLEPPSIMQARAKAGLGLVTKAHKEVELRLEAAKVQVTLRAAISESRSATRMHAEYVSSAHVVYREPVALERVFDVNAALSSFLLLLTGSASSAQAVAVQPAAGSGGEQRLVDFADVFYSSPFHVESTRALQHLELLTTQATVGDGLEAALDKWLADYEQLRVPSSLLFDAFAVDADERTQFADVELLNLVQAAEGLHRLFHHSPLVDEGEFEEHVGVIERFVKEQALVGPQYKRLRGNIYGGLRLANQPDLKTRLLELCACVHEALEPFIHDVDAFTSAVKHERNAIVHRLSDATPSPGPRMAGLLVRLRWLLLSYLLHHVGIGPEAYREANGYWVNLFRQLENTKDWYAQD